MREILLAVFALAVVQITILWLDTETYSEVPIKWGTYR